MVKLIIIALIAGALIIGDIVWDFGSELLWNLGLRLPGVRLNFDKRKRPKRSHYKYR